MVKWFTSFRCPICDNSTCNSQRVRRKPWMRMLPISRYYRCHVCCGKFLVVLGLISLVHGGAKAKFTPKAGRALSSRVQGHFPETGEP